MDDARMDDGLAPKVLTWAGAYTISFVGLIHLLVSDEHFEAAPPYLGWLFLANFAGATVAAIGIAWAGTGGDGCWGMRSPAARWYCTW